MNNNFYGKFYLFFRLILKYFWGRHKVVNEQNVLTPAIYVSHHLNQLGPNVMLLWFSKPFHLWVYYPFCNQKTCFKQYMDYTLTKRLHWNRFFAAAVAYPLSCFISAFCKSAKAIPVYRDSRSVITFRQSVKVLQNGESIMLFPDIDYQSNDDKIGEMYKGFMYLDKYYFKACGSHIPFIPVYVSKLKKEIIVGNSVCFSENTDYERVYSHIQDQLNSLAKEKLC